MDSDSDIAAHSNYFIMACNSEFCPVKILSATNVELLPGYRTKKRPTVLSQSPIQQ
jgi:hypothetical protein